MKNLSKLVNQNIFKRSFSSFIGKNISENNQTFYAKDLTIEERIDKQQKPGPDHQYAFGAITTDHMLHCDYDKDNGGWQKPRITAV